MSMYRCKKYICGREWAAGETGNVICLERMLINYLLEWYRLSRKNRDTALRKCMERALNQELRSEECALLPLRYRVKIVLALYSLQSTPYIFRMALGAESEEEIRWLKEICVQAAGPARQYAVRPL